MNFTITASGIITPQSVQLNNQLVMHNELPFDRYARNLYKKLNLDYPKFFKMDNLCQLAFLATELLTGHINEWNGDEVAIILGNNNSSLVSDQRHYQSIADETAYFPSPAVFVYTLPNIMLGEICIRHKITGENSCFMMERLDTGFLHHYTCQLFECENYRYCITGFVDYTEESYIAQLFLVEPGNVAKGPLTHDFTENFNQLDNN